MLDPEVSSTPKERVLAAVDFSPASVAAYRLAAKLAADLDRDLYIVHVATHARPIDSITAIGKPEVDGEAMVMDPARTRIEEMIHANTTGRAPTDTIISDATDAARGIIREARPTDLIVVGTHGKSDLKSALMGSTAHDVIRHAPCPVVVAPNGAQG